MAFQKTTMVYSYFTTKRPYCLLSLIFIIMLYILTNNMFKHSSSSSSPSTVFNKYFNSILNPSDSCTWKFDQYSPSPWELYWYNNITYLQKTVCPTLKRNDQLNKSITALEYIINLQKKIFHQSPISNEYDELFSKMYYRFECPKSSQSNLRVSQYIEPLIGLLRDPLTICVYENLPTTYKLTRANALQSKRFLLLGPSAPYQNFQTPTPSIAPWLHPEGSQKILFDIGSSYFNDMYSATKITSAIGTRWFYEYFRLNSLRFDRIIAFEANQYSPELYWKQIPEDIMSSFTFINNRVEKSGKFNPWNILKSMVKPNDYVIIKLDIDTPTLEFELINQILNDTSISSLIDEMFFEFHVTVKETLHFWGKLPHNLKDAYTLFTQLRQLGIRMHSWP